MKKLIQIFGLFLCTILFLSSTGYSGNKHPEVIPTVIDEETTKAATKEILDLLNSGDFDAIIERAGTELKAQLSAEVLKAGWNGEAVTLGKFQSVIESSIVQQNNPMVIQLLSQYENGKILLTCSFNAQMQLTGLNLKKVPDKIAEPLAMDLPEGATEKAVVLHAGTDKELHGIIILPQGANSSTPAVVFAQGSGSSDMDETVGPNKPFRDIAYGLAERGIASIRYDKLPYAHPELFSKPDMTIDLEYTCTVLEALRVLRDNSDIGPVYMLGHSQGGMLTPYFIEQSNGGFSGGIILAGTPRKLWEVMYDQNMDIIQSMPEKQRTDTLALVEAERDKVHALSQMSNDELLTAKAFGISGYYLKHLNDIDALKLIHKNNVPMLILQGEADFQVSMDKDFSAWAKGLDDMGDIITFRSYPNLSHLFMTARGNITNAQEAYSIPDTVDSTVIADIATWILSQ